VAADETSAPGPSSSILSGVDVLVDRRVVGQWGICPAGRSAGIRVRIGPAAGQCHSARRPDWRGGERPTTPRPGHRLLGRDSARHEIAGNRGQRGDDPADSIRSGSEVGRNHQRGRCVCGNPRPPPERGFDLGPGAAGTDWNTRPLHVSMRHRQEESHDSSLVFRTARSVTTGASPLKRHDAWYRIVTPSAPRTERGPSSYTR